MAFDLSDLKPSELSIVRRGAVRRPFLFAKADEENEQADVTNETVAALIKSSAELSLDEITKHVAAPGSDGGDGESDPVAKAEEWSGIYKREISADALKAADKADFADPDSRSFPILEPGDVAAAADSLGRANPDTSEHRDEIKARIIDIAHRKGPAFVSQLPKAWNIKKNEEDDMPEGTGAVTAPVKKDDGTWDLSGVPEDQRAGYEALLKAHDDEVAELRKAQEAEASKAEEALKIAKAEKDARELREHIAKAETLEHLGSQPAELGSILHSVAKAEADKHLPEGTGEKIEAILKAADEAARVGGIFKEAGNGGAAPGSAAEEMNAKAAEIRKADPAMSLEKARTLAYEQNPDLYARMREEG